MDESGTITVLAVSMTQSRDPLDLLSSELTSRSSSSSGRRALRRLAAAGVDTDGVYALTELVDRYHRLAHTKDQRTRATLEKLLELARSDEDAALCAMVSLRPALRWVAARVYGPGPTEDELAELVCLAWDAICDGPSHKVPRERYVVLAARNRARAAQRQRQRHLTGPEIDRVSEIDAVEPADDSVLACALAAGVLRQRDAELIDLTRAFGVPIEILARENGCDAKTLMRRRQRAEATVRQWRRSQGER